MIRKLRLKFIAVIMALVLVLLGVIFGLIVHFTRLDLERESVTMMQNIASMPLRQVPPDRWPEGLPEDRPENVRLPYFTVVLDEYGEPSAFGGGYYDLSDEAFLREILDAALASGQHIGILEEYGLRFCVSRVREYDCAVFADMSSERNTLNNLQRTCAAIGALSFAAFFAIAVFLSRWMTGPVEQAWRQQRQFVADASHELKTPLTVIMANAELMQGGGDEGEKRRFAGNILTVSRQMRTLVEQLLELARMDSALETPAMEPVGFSRLVEDAVLPFEPVIFERGLTLETEITGGITVRGDGQQLHQVVDILLDNAQKYACDGGTVHVELKKAGHARVQLCVSDPGPAISEKDLHNIFKRFYRADQARSASGSFGLGLSIAQSIVQGHSGKIWAESKNGVNCFYVELPCSG